MTAKLAKIVLSIAAGMLGVVLVMTMLACSGPAAAREDIEGNSGSALAAGSPHTVAVAASPTRIRADGASTAAITGTVKDEWNQWVSDAFIALTTSLGTIDAYCYAEAEGASVNRSSGDWTTVSDTVASGGQYVKTSGTVSPTATLSWTFTATAISMLYVSDSGSGGVAEVQVDDGTPVTVAMCSGTMMAAERVIAAGLETGSHTITVTQLTSPPECPGGPVIRIDAFRCGDTTDASGKGTATLTSEDLSCGSQTATVTALTGGPTVHYMITDTVSVEMVASTPHSMTVTASDNEIVVGVGISTLEATVEDEFGEYVPDCTMVGFFVTDEDGAAAGEAWATLVHDFVEGEATEVITSGSWISYTGVSGYHGGGYISSVTGEDTASWTFTGTAVSLIYAKTSDSGVATVTVDSGSPITIDMYASPDQFQVEHVITHALGSGPHVITVTVAGITRTAGATDTRVNVDAFRSGASTLNGKATAVLTAGMQAGVVWAEATAVGRQCCEVTSLLTDTVPITLTAGNPYTLTITPTDIITTCCSTSTLQFTVTDQYNNVVGDVVSRTLAVTFTSTPHGIFTDTTGVLTDGIVVVTQGVGSLIFHGWTSGTGTITGTVNGVTGTSNLTVTAGTCSLVEVRAGRSQIYVTDESTGILTDFHYTTTITADVTDACGNAVAAGTLVTFTTSLGTFPVTDEDFTAGGMATVTLASEQLPTGVPTRTAYITATACSGVTGTTTVTFGWHVYTLTVTADPDQIKVDATSELSATVYDGFGDPARDGVMVGFVTDEDGSDPGVWATLPYEFVEVVTDEDISASTGWEDVFLSDYHGGHAISGTNTGITVTWAFTGTAVSLMYPRLSSAGVASVTVDSGAPITIDMYASSPQYQVEKVITNTLSYGRHTVVVTVAGYKNAASSANTVYLDAFRSGTTTSGGTGWATATVTAGTQPGGIRFVATAIGSTVTNTVPITITAGDPDAISLTPTDINITCCVTSTLYFTVTDQYNNVVGAVVSTSLTMKFTESVGSLTEFAPASEFAITDGIGSVGVHGWTSGTGYIQGSPGYGVWTTSTLTVLAGEPVTLTVTSAPDTIRADDTDTAIITATVQDACANFICNRVVTFTTDFGSFETLTKTLLITETTNCPGGVATATLRSWDTKSGTANITVTVDSLTGTTQVDIVGAVFKVELEANPTSIEVGGYTSALTATVEDVLENPVEDGTVVTFTTSLGELGSGTGTTTGGVATTVLTSETEAGTAFITATAGSKSDSITVTIEAGSPATVTLEACPTSIAIGGSTSALTATVKDQYNNNVEDGTVVTFTTSLGQVGSTTVTDTTSSGVATAVLTSETTAGTAIITATSGSVTGTTTVTFTASSAHTVTLEVEPTSLTVDASSSLTATVKDQYSNNVEDGTVVTFTTSLGSLSSDTPTTANGKATATLTSQEAGTATITATIGMTSAVKTVVFSVGAPATVTLEADPEIIEVGGLTSTLTVTVTDQYGNNVADDTEVLFETSLGVVGSTEVTKTTSSGVATAVLTSQLEAGTAIITATAGSEVATTTVEFITPYPPYTVTLVAHPMTLTVGSSSTLTATVEDVGSNPLEGEVVTFTASSGILGSDTITKTTNAGGVATATLTSETSGTATVIATADDVSDTVDVTFESGQPYTVTLGADPESIGVGGLTSTLTVTATDEYGNNVADGTDVFFETSLGGVGSTEITKTTSSGVATAVLTSPNTVGTAFVTATVGSEIATTTVEFTPLSPYTVTLVAHPMTLTVGSSSTLTATVTDEHGNNVADSTVVTFETSLGSLGSIVTETTVSGVATAVLTSETPGTATVIATADDVSDTVDVTFESGLPYTVTLEADPESIGVGGLTSTLTVTATDQYGNNVADGTDVFFETSQGEVGSTSVTKTTSSGVATAVLTSGTEAGTAFVTATVGSKVATTTVEFTPLSPYAVTLVAHPMTLTVGSNSTLTATVKDQYNNNVADGTVVTFTTSLGEVGSTEIAKTTTSGVAMAELTSQLPGTASVIATADTVSDTVDVTFEVGPPYTVTLVVYPTSLTVGDTSTLTATVRDQYNNNVADDTEVLFGTSLGSLGSSTVIKLTANGVATATLTSEESGTAAVTATSDSKYGTASVTFGPDVPYTMTVEAYPTSIPIGGFTSTITATLEDQYGNPVADGTEVTFAESSGDLDSSGVARSTVHGVAIANRLGEADTQTKLLAVIETTVNGVATVTLTSGWDTGIATVTAYADSLEGQTQVTFTVGAPHYIDVEASPSTIEVDGNTSTIMATVSDIGGYPVADDTPVVFTTDFASLGSDTVTKYTTDGVAVATLTSGLVPGTATVTATADSRSNTVIVNIVPGPPFRIDVTADPIYVPIGGATSDIVAIVSDRHGNNVADGTNVDFLSFPLGSVSPQSDTTINGVAETTLTSGIIKGLTTVHAQSGSATGWVDVTFTVGPPFYVNVVASPMSIGLDGQTSNIQATVKDIGGNDVADGTEVNFVTSLGILDSDTEPTVGGVAEVVLTSETDAGTAVITATADSKYDITTVTIRPGPPDTVVLTADPVAICAGGASKSTLRATVTDQYGNNVANGTSVDFSTTKGSIWPPSATTINGVAETELTSSVDTGFATVTAVCQGKSDDFPVIFWVCEYKAYLPIIFKAY